MNSDVYVIGSLLSVLIYKCVEATFPCYADYKQLDMKCPPARSQLLQFNLLCACVSVKERTCTVIH